MPKEENPIPPSVEKNSLTISQIEDFASSVNFANASENPANISEGLYIFYSFDLANSTSYKSNQPEEWPVLITPFLNKVPELMQIEQENAYGTSGKVYLWKTAGDEVLFYQKINCMKDVYSVVPICNEIMKKLKGFLSDFDYNHQLDVKATLWCARTIEIFSTDSQKAKERVGKVEGSCRNLVWVVDPNQPRNKDFLGQDIDAGFRIAKFALPGRIALSAELALILHKMARDKVLEKIWKKYGLKSVDEHIKIICYQKLKGIWDEQGYPIIWFEEKWDEFKFRYDEHLTSDFVSFVESKKREDVLMLVDVYEQRRRWNNFEDFLDFCKGLDDVDLGLAETIPPKSYAELHCVPVIMSYDGAILCAKRSMEKRRFKGYWEFGCGQLRMGETIERCVIRTCLEDFNVEIDESKPIEALGLFSFGKEERRTIPGVLVLVFCANKGKEKFYENRHSELRWAAIDDDLSSFVPHVSDFKDTIDKARKKFSEIL